MKQWSENYFVVYFCIKLFILQEISIDFVLRQLITKEMYVILSWLGTEDYLSIPELPPDLSSVNIIAKYKKYVKQLFLIWIRTYHSSLL